LSLLKCFTNAFFFAENTLLTTYFPLGNYIEKAQESKQSNELNKAQDKRQEISRKKFILRKNYQNNRQIYFCWIFIQFLAWGAITVQQIYANQC
jgi:uncharacterized membrane protein (DUF106 family)